MAKMRPKNETTNYLKFETGRWYTVLLTVQQDRIEARLDGKQIVVVRICGCKVSTCPRWHCPNH